MIAGSIDPHLETSLIVEDLRKSSLKIFLRNRLKEIPDEIIKDPSAKKVIGHFLLKAKYAAIKWLDEPEETRRSLPDLTSEIARLARESDVRRLPDYPPPNSAKLAQALDGFQETKSLFGKKEGLVITLGEDQYTVDTSSTWSPSTVDWTPEANKELVNESDMFLIIAKPALIGDSKWEFKHGKRTIRAKITDSDWISDFKARKYSLKSGDAMRVRVRVEATYDARGNLIGSEEVVTRVYEIIEAPDRLDGLFGPEE